MLTITKRDCLLSPKHKGYSKQIDSVELRLLTIGIDEVMLEAQELNALLCEPLAHQVLFNTGKRPPEPYLQCLKELELKEPAEHAYAAITYGLHSQRIEFKDCKISKIKLQPRVGGMTSLSCELTAAPILDASLADLFEQLGNAAEVELRADSPGAQQDLSLNKFGEGEQGAKPKRGRKPKHAELN